MEFGFLGRREWVATLSGTTCNCFGSGRASTSSLSAYNVSSFPSSPFLLSFGTICERNAPYKFNKVSTYVLFVMVNVSLVIVLQAVCVACAMSSICTQCKLIYCLRGIHIKQYKENTAPLFTRQLFIVMFHCSLTTQDTREIYLKAVNTESIGIEPVAATFI